MSIHTEEEKWKYHRLPPTLGSRDSHPLAAAARPALPDYTVGTRYSQYLCTVEPVLGFWPRPRSGWRAMLGDFQVGAKHTRTHTTNGDGRGTAAARKRGRAILTLYFSCTRISICWASKRRIQFESGRWTSDARSKSSLPAMIGRCGWRRAYGKVRGPLF